MSEVSTIGKDFSTGELIRFASIPVLTRFATSLLMTLDDGLFLSRFVGPNALAAFSIAMPVFMLIGAIADLFGGVAVVCATKMGEKKNQEACGDFTAVAIALTAFSFLFAAVIIIFMDPIMRFLGGTDILFPYIKAFFSVSAWYIPLSQLSFLFSRFYVPAGKPQYSMATTVISTLCNFFFDYLFIVRLQIGISGAAWSNLIANLAVVTFGLIFFSGKNCEIGFAKPSKNIWPLLLKCFKLGLPPFLTSIALSINGYIANQVLLDAAGEECVAAYTIVNNIQFLFMSGLFGFSGAVCPIISYAYGEKNSAKIRKTMNQIIKITAMLTVLIIGVYLTARNLLLSLYIKDSTAENVRTMANYGLTVGPLAFLFFNFNVIAIDIFSALNDSKTATKLTVLQNMLFANLPIILLPHIFGLNGIWFAFACGELMTFFFSSYYFLGVKKKYAS